jgi:hypothetical protein
MKSHVLQRFALVAVALLIAACQASAENPDHAACRRDWVKAFNIVFDNSISNSDVRFMHACMAKRGYKRIYDAERCAKLEASIREPGCYAKG